MTRANMTLSIFLSVLILSAAFPLAAQTSISGQQDIASLLERARQTFDLDKEEAVFLFAGRKEL